MEKRVFDKIINLINVNQLITADFDNLSLDPSQVTELVKALKVNTSIISLNLRNTLINFDRLKLIVENLPCSATSLNIKGIRLNSKHLTEIADALTYNYVIEKVDIESPAITKIIARNKVKHHMVEGLIAKYQFINTLDIDELKLLFKYHTVVKAHICKNNKDAYDKLITNLFHKYMNYIDIIKDKDFFEIINSGYIQNDIPDMAPKDSTLDVLGKDVYEEGSFGLTAKL